MFHKFRQLQKRERTLALNEFFKDINAMVCPVEAARDLPFNETLRDKQFIHCIDSIGRAFAIGVVFRAADEMAIVYLPGDSSAIDTYFSFIKSPPSFVSTRIGPLYPLGGDSDKSVRIVVKDPAHEPLDF